MERSLTRRIKDRFPLSISFLLILVGLYIYSRFLQENPLFTIVLFSISTVTMLVVYNVWKYFTAKYAPEIIYWTTTQKYARKIIAGGSFSYYEYQPNIYKITLMAPIMRFVNLMLAFLSLAATAASLLDFSPQSPVENIYTVWVWGAMIFFIPLILTPIIPIIWTMEDLQLKAWNAKWNLNVRISARYKARFNSILAIGAIGTAFGLTGGPDLLTRASNFGLLLLEGVEALTYPISVLTLLYFINFRESIRSKVLEKMKLPVAETKLIYRNFEGDFLNQEGDILFTKEVAENEEEYANALASLQTGEVPPPVKAIDQSEDLSDEPIQPDTFIGRQFNSINARTKSLGKGLRSTGQNIQRNTIGRIFPKKQPQKNESNDQKSKKRFTKGSATEGLWEHEEKDPKQKGYKYKGGSATKGLWDEDEK